MSAPMVLQHLALRLLRRRRRLPVAFFLEFPRNARAIPLVSRRASLAPRVRVTLAIFVVATRLVHDIVRGDPPRDLAGDAGAASAAAHHRAEHVIDHRRCGEVWSGS